VGWPTGSVDAPSPGDQDEGEAHQDGSHRDPDEGNGEAATREGQTSGRVPLGETGAVAEGVDEALWVAFTVADGVAVAFVVLVGLAVLVEAALLGLVVGVVAHFVSVNTLLSRVTLPLRASARPSILAPVLREMEVSAMIVPTNRVLVPRVADVPTCQKTWQLCASFSSTTRLLDAVVRPDPIWKTNTASGSPSASRVR
jgi:hypothetical protein